MELRLRVRKFEARLRDIEKRVFGTRKEAESTAASLRKTRRELARKGAEVTAAEIRVVGNEEGWRVRVTELDGTGRNWISAVTELEGTGRNQTELEGTDLLGELLEGLEE